MSEEKPTVTYDDFVKLDLRVATIVEASDHPNADKLIVLKIDLGGEQRQIIAGIKGYYDAEAMVGKQLVVVANLAPRKMRGLASEGMLLAASVPGEEGLPPADVVLLTVDRLTPPGAPVS